MQFWQQCLLLLAVLWGFQALGTWLQMRHYSRLMREIARTWPDGCLGASAARRTFGRGAIALVVAAPDETVRQVFVMEGRSVFAKFRELPLAGRNLAALASDSLATAHASRQKAIAGAVTQIRTVLARRAAAASPAPAA